MRILFAGGCHLDGYPVGKENAFQYVTARHLGSQKIDCEIRSISYVPLHHPEMLVRPCLEWRPRIVVLQLCHYELSGSLRSHLCSLLGIPKAKQAAPRGWHVTPVPRRSRSFYVGRSALKEYVDAILGHSAVDLGLFESRLEDFLAEVDRCGVEKVLYLSPLPCIDRVVLYYRRRAAPVIEAAARRHGCVYLDVSTLEPKRRERDVGRENFFADGAHLGVRGHIALGRGVAETLMRIIPAHDACAVRETLTATAAECDA